MAKITKIPAFHIKKIKFITYKQSVNELGTCIQATKGGTDAAGIINSRARKRSRNGECRNKRTDQITRPNGNHLLTGINFHSFS